MKGWQGQHPQQEAFGGGLCRAATAHEKHREDDLGIYHNTQALTCRGYAGIHGHGHSVRCGAVCEDWRRARRTASSTSASSSASLVGFTWGVLATCACICAKLASIASTSRCRNAPRMASSVAKDTS